jgi:protein-tyrosine phosphatase
MPYGTRNTQYASAFSMIDLHAHILHDLDDGPRDLAGAVVIAEAAVADGVTTLAATPHGRSRVSVLTRYSVARLHAQLTELRAALQEAGVPLEIVAGTECYGESGIVERLRAGELLPYGTSRAVLVEFPSQINQAALEQLVFELQLAGYRVIIAHPERLRYVQHDPNALIPLIERGALLQLTADALLGNQGERLRRLAETLLTHRLVQVLASDCHGLHLNRMPNLGAARERAAELHDAAFADQLTRTTPAAILANGPITALPPLRVRRM